ncbi:MAG: DUF4430 domain-containing protein [Patulibacter sp.]|nr:DUF4430 domain-containing protein [Patulibacter sp.]
MVALVAATAAISGCGVGAGETPEDVGLRVTDRFGSEVVVDRPRAEVEGEDTVVRLLQRNVPIETDAGGTFVSAIDGRVGGEAADGSTPYWVFFRNGVLSDKGAAGVQVADGDRIWWDRHDQRIANVQGVVGSFPMPFTAREDGEPPAVELGCVDVAAAACRIAGERLTAAGVAVTAAELAPQSAPNRLRVLVGPWDGIRRDPVAARLEAPPRTSGVLARVRDERLIPYRADGTAAPTIGAGWGLIAATRVRREPMTWVVSGRTALDAQSAAELLTADVLDGAFALLVRDRAPRPLPFPAAE